MLLPAEDAQSLTNAPTQAQFREQLANLTDLLRQVFGDAVVVPGSGGPSDPLNAAFELFVDPVRGSDKFVHGDYNSYDPGGASIDDQIINKLRRLSNQRLTCGYTRERPFRTINRAAIECAIITSRSWFINDPKTHVDCIVVNLSAGVHVVLNDPGIGAVVSWPDGHVPTDKELIAFNPPEGGVILPRFASMQGINLRKTTLRPSFVPGTANEASDYSNRSCFVRTTPNALIFSMSFFDHWSLKRSHHLLSCFGFASQTQLNTFYTKVGTACAAGADLDLDRLVARPSEISVVGPFAGQPDESWDVTTSSSCYVYNCSIRSDYGIAGIFADGSQVGGLKSMVVAQFTGVSMQRDLSCWQVYKNNAWEQPADYAALVASDPDDTRMHPNRLSRHISAINKAFIQEVSVFAIGQGVHHYVDSGGEITITNSNSSFGGCSALARGYRDTPYPIDRNWQVSNVKVPTNLAEKSGNIKRIRLGRIAFGTANNATTLVLEDILAQAPEDPNTPQLLAKDGYSLRALSYIWVDNPTGKDFRAKLAVDAWSNERPGEIKIVLPVVNQDGVRPGDAASSGQVAINTPNLEGLVVYVRRMVDVRSPDERKYSLQLTNTTNTRTPVRNFVLQLDTSSSGINRPLAANETLTVVSAIRRDDPNTGANYDAEVTLRAANPVNPWMPSLYYRSGDTVLRGSKHWTCNTNHFSAATFNPALWAESFVHMPSTFNPEDFFKNEGPIVVFNNDTDGDELSRDCGYNLQTVWIDDPLVKAQVVSATDFRGLRLFLSSLGFSITDLPILMEPQTTANRTWNPQAGVAGINPPAGAAVGWSNWAVQFQRPSVIRLYSHAWEWAGFLNYSKSLPPVQAEMTPQNKFTYYFTNENGGRVFATGNNEDGYEVSPAGLTSISTGEQVSVENIGGSDTNFDISTNFDALTVNELTVSGTLKLQGTVQGLPRASVPDFGVVQLASSSETTNAFLSNTFDPLRAGAAVSLGTMAGLKDGVLRQVRILERKFSRIYVDGSIVRAGTTYENPADSVTIPIEIWQDIKWQRDLHELPDWPGDVPPTTHPAYFMGGLLCFRTLNQATDFIANRNVVDNTPIRINVYGSSQCTGWVMYHGTTELTIAKGRSQLGQSSGKQKGMAPTIYMASNVFYFGEATRVSFYSLDIDVNGALLSPGAFGVQTWAIYFSGRASDSTSMLCLYNVYIRLYMDSGYWMFFVLNVRTLSLHTVLSSIDELNWPTAGAASRITFDAKRKKSPGSQSVGWNQIARTGNLWIESSRTNWAAFGFTGIDSARETNYLMDFGTDYGSGCHYHGIRLFDLFDGRFTLWAQQDDSNPGTAYLGSTTNFDISLGPAGYFAYICQGGIESREPSMGTSMVLDWFRDPSAGTGGGPAVPGDPKWDQVVNVTKLVAGVGAASNASSVGFVVLMDIGSGSYQNFKQGFSDPNHWLDRHATAFYNALINGGNTNPSLISPGDSNIYSSYFARLAMSSGGHVNTFFALEYSFWPLKRVTNGGVLVRFVNRLASNDTGRMKAASTLAGNAALLDGVPSNRGLDVQGNVVDQTYALSHTDS